MTYLFLLLFSIIPLDNNILCDTFDKVELNHFYDDQGRHVFDQVIWWEWDILHNFHKIQAWRLVKHPSMIPIFNQKTQIYESLFYDNDILRRVNAKYMVESWTQYDVELVDREVFPKERRTELKNRTNLNDIINLRNLRYKK